LILRCAAARAVTPRARRTFAVFALILFYALRLRATLMTGAAH